MSACVLQVTVGGKIFVAFKQIFSLPRSVVLCVYVRSLNSTSWDVLPLFLFLSVCVRLSFSFGGEIQSKIFVGGFESKLVAKLILPHNFFMYAFLWYFRTHTHTPNIVHMPE